MKLNEIINSEIKDKCIVNIAIAGLTCSGKTTLANELEKTFSNEFSVTIIKQDDYFKDLCDFRKDKYGYVTDTPNAFHIDEFRQDVKKLLSAFKATVPRYDISNNKRISKDVQKCIGQINIFEGLHTIQLLNDIEGILKVFLNTKIETCLKRRIERDTCLYNIPKEIIEKKFNLSMLPIFNTYIKPQQGQADIIIDENKF